MTEDSQTPTEPPHAVLAVHRPYILVLAAAITPLNSVANHLGEVLHELRLAREPIGDRVLQRISELGATLEGVGASIKRGFQQR